MGATLLWTAVPVLAMAAVMLGRGWTLRRQASVLAGTVFGALGVTAAVSGWILIADHEAGLADALKTGGLGGGAAVALYGLWLNDRRRRTEEQRQEVERSRISHERFARAVELLGNDADQVRVGALHALAGLAQGTPSYTQTVLDVLCSYLRRPFDHPWYRNAGDQDREHPVLRQRSWTQPLASDPEADRERQVRLTAQRLIRELLPVAGNDAPLYSLDLSGATVEYFDLSGLRVGGILARQAVFLGITRLYGVEFHGNAMFSGARFHGRVRLDGTVFAAGASLLGVGIDGSADLTGASFHGFADLRATDPENAVVAGVTVDTRQSIKLPDAWCVEPRDGSSIGALVVSDATRTDAADS